MFKNPTLILFLILFVSAALRLFNLDFADGKPVFDERGNYLRAVRTYFSGEDDTVPEHPPLGKELIAVGMLLFGDTPFGWRVPSLVFSLIGIALVYVLARGVFGGHFVPLASSLLLAIDSMYFIYSRLAVLDMFLTVFVLLTLLFLWRVYRYGRLSNLLSLSLFFGLALATKWTALQLAPVMLLFLFLRYHWKKLLGVMGVMGVVGGVVYVTTYAPYLTRHSFSELVDLQRSIVLIWNNFDRDRVFTWVTYFSRHVHSWIFNPMTAYFAEPTTDGKLRIVIGLYNPVILWGGLLWAVWGVRKWNPFRFTLSTLFLLLPILSNFLPWFFVRRVQYSYYFLPSLPLLVLLVASVLERARRAFPDRVAIFFFSAILMFGYLFPFLIGVPMNPRFLNPHSSGPIHIRTFYDETLERVIFFTENP